MTDAELWELIIMSLGNAASIIAIYLSVTSGYLIVSYLVGKNLTRMQNTLITGLYITFAVIITLATVANFDRAAYLLKFTEETYRSPLSSGLPAVAIITGPILLIGVAACVKFMWDVRHPKTE